jgi:hypothetical protein
MAALARTTFEGARGEKDGAVDATPPSEQAPITARVATAAVATAMRAVEKLPDQKLERLM